MKKLHIYTPIKDATRTRSRPDGVVITGLRGRHQLDKYSCGAAAVATALCAYSGSLRKGDWQVIVGACRPSVARGTPVERLVDGLRSTRLDCSNLSDMSPERIKKCLSRGDLIITTTPMPRQGEGASHWVVIVGATDREVLILNHTGLPLSTRKWVSWEQIMTDSCYHPFNQPFVIVHTRLNNLISDRRHEAARSAHAS